MLFEASPLSRKLKVESETWKKILACCHYECAPVDPIHICFCRISMARLRPPGRVLINLLSNFLAAALSGKSRILWQDWLLMIRRDQFSIWSAGSWILLLLPDAPLSLPPVHCANCGNVVRFLKQKAFVVPPPSSLRCRNQNNQNHQQQTKSWWARIVSTILKLRLEKVEKHHDSKSPGDFLSND